jgi:hypothetical protein
LIGWLFCGFALFYAASAYGIGLVTYQFVLVYADHVGFGDH